MAKSRYLTKSRFKVACECPTKLYYLNKNEYGSTKNDNAFLEALAEGGFQVGELAKIYYEGGTEIISLDYDKSIAETKALLQNPNAIIYEPAFQFNDYFVRVDILNKTDKKVDLIEVKAKSFDSKEDRPFWKKRSKGLSSEWEPYLLDVAFQTYVARKSWPSLVFSPFLMLADKSSVASVDGINQKFMLKTEGGRTRAVASKGLRSKDLGSKLLALVSVSEEVEFIFSDWKWEGMSFEKLIQWFSSAYKKDEKLTLDIGSKCKACEFRVGPDLKIKGNKSGFDECWTQQAKISESDLRRPFVFDLWNFRQSDSLIESGHYFIDQLSDDDFKPSKEKQAGLSQSERQMIQAQKVRAKDDKPFVDIDGLSTEMNKWQFPLHFIDFETTMAAIPFNKGRRPYEQIAFQFSHHVLDKDGQIVHKTEYINKQRGEFPNFEFVRNLKVALEADSGTIFRYATHENTVLCQIHEQLMHSKESDRDELCSWIETITVKQGDEGWSGSRSMVDLCEIVKRYYFSPLTGGSNSIKKVLPAILSSSEFLQKKYSSSIYGSETIRSLNFKNWSWIKKDSTGKIIDPYKLLDPIFTDIDVVEMDTLVDGTIADGGAAMTAYARMQFTEMSELEVDRVTNALLKYCELDTFAMVLIYEYWANLLGISGKREAA